jgi:hypothetical protein
VRFENGMRLFRLTNRGGKRITVLDADPPAASRAWAENDDAMG